VAQSAIARPMIVSINLWPARLAMPPVGARLPSGSIRST
jgi:hypothetical protein